MRVSGFSPERAREIEGSPTSVAWSKAAESIEATVLACQQGLVPVEMLALGRLSPVEREAFLAGMGCAAKLIRSGLEELLAALAREPGP